MVGMQTIHRIGGGVADSASPPPFNNGVAMNDNVVQINIPPAKWSELYNGYEIHYAFHPASGQWHWSFTVHVPDLVFEDFAATRNEAMKAAHKQIARVERHEH